MVDNRLTRLNRTLVGRCTIDYYAVKQKKGSCGRIDDLTYTHLKSGIDMLVRWFAWPNKKKNEEKSNACHTRVFY